MAWRGTHDSGICLGYQSHSVVSLEDYQIYERFMTELKLQAEVKAFEAIESVSVFDRCFPTFAKEVTMQWPNGSGSPRNPKYYNALR